MYFRNAVVICAILASLGCSKSEMAAKNLERAYLERLKNTLKDADSAKFKGVRVVEQKNGSQVVCGEVNAKNSYGGYTGFQDFYVAPGATAIVEALDANYAEFCMLAGYSVEDVKAQTREIMAETRRIEEGVAR